MILGGNSGIGGANLINMKRDERRYDIKLIAPDECYLWCHRCKEELKHTADVNAYVCQNCSNRKHLAEVVAVYSTWDHKEYPQVLALPMNLLTTPDAAHRLRQLWLDNSQESLLQTELITSVDMD